MRFLQRPGVGGFRLSSLLRQQGRANCHADSSAKASQFQAYDADAKWRPNFGLRQIEESLPSITSTPMGRNVQGPIANKRRRKTSSEAPVGTSARHWWTV
ncbi:hypothetical protein BV898_04053 [Hypsibius exemplaris]|uniref:Uncharacterized protein n=1 Tax=Hypsibius exemplaris TaxID=2072580 RepID=A0A1W0X2Y7_HYPEX|nr:hypothetical protein BV898_04053 [Hypsibius exemplaris]